METKTDVEAMEKKIPELKDIYREFTHRTDEYKSGQACEKGCSFCCREAGSITVTTLEGLAVRAAMKALLRSRQKTLTRMFQQEIKKKEKGDVVPCPFLMKNNTCMIYEDRPFSCRRIYSTHVCTPKTPPMVSRQVMKEGYRTIKRLQELDINGYSGHMSYILYMLSIPEFLDTYLGGDFKPRDIMVFGKSHKIVINRMMVVV
ncbi:MAG: YkgJ family cysteine cluster protein [Thermodesulfobacteriota bacterium]|nr:YkgJ family cysteine cluster protein [Thermodesulfobacteriota bacterium]